MSSALNHGNVYNPKPHADAFLDPRLDNPTLGTEWWRCPSSNPNRTIFPINAYNACETNVPLIQTEEGGQFRDGGAVWQCPSSHPRRTVFAVGSNKACEARTSGGSFIDLNGGHYTCDGWRRTVFSVTSNEACETGDWPWEYRYRAARKLGDAWAAANRISKNGGGEFTSAIFISKHKQPKPTGAFEDPRLDLDPHPLNIDNDEYWSCPAGFWRNLNPVTHADACTVNVGQNCDAGNIAVGIPWSGKGYRCEKLGVCGANGQRPCQIVERIPSCDSGLAEDFVENKCVDKNLAMCLTVTRAVWLANEGSKGVNAAMQELEKPINFAIEEIIKTIPPAIRAKLDEGAEAINREVIEPVENEINKGVSKILADIEGEAGPFAPLVQSMRNPPDKKKLADLFSDTSICTASADVLRSRVQEALGSTDLSNMGTLAAISTPERSWAELGLDALINPAYAHTQTFTGNEASYLRDCRSECTIRVRQNRRSRARPGHPSDLRPP